jgi:hypothetical protein
VAPRAESVVRPLAERIPAVSAKTEGVASPAIMTEKNTPIDSAVPEFWKVERMPEAAPRWLAGTLPMIEEELGAANIPLPIPSSVAMNMDAVVLASATHL